MAQLAPGVIRAPRYAAVQALWYVLTKKNASRNVEFMYRIIIMFNI